MASFSNILDGRSRALTKARAERLAETFRVLGDPNRLRILSFIASQPGGEACVCDLMSPIGISQPTVSHHLKVLHEAGLLDREKRGIWVYYRVRDDDVVGLLNLRV